MFGNRIVFAHRTSTQPCPHWQRQSDLRLNRCHLRVVGGQPEERAAVCHTQRTGRPLTAPVYASGATTGQDSWCGLGEVWGRDGADMGAHAGGGDGITDGRQ